MYDRPYLEPRTPIKASGRETEMSLFCRASEAKFGKMVENKVVATIKIWTEPKFHRNRSNGSKDTAIFAYVVNHTCERVR